VITLNRGLSEISLRTRASLTDAEVRVELEKAFFHIFKKYGPDNTFEASFRIQRSSEVLYS
jgi:hypothetical protein